MARKATHAHCTKGNHDVPVSEFYKDKSQKSGHSPWCKACERAYNRAYRAGLKKAGADKKGNIEESNVKGRRAFEREMKSERVTRTRKSGANARATTRARARTRKAKGNA